jgi:tryptophanyl-tRNA synthetase
VLSGIQPTADSFHVGNYLGAVRNWVALQDDHDAFYCVVDLHAITVQPHDPAQLRTRSRTSTAQLLAAGLDPARCSLFLQSHIREHAELGWIMGCITGFGEAQRMTQFKDKSAKAGSETVTVGFFCYPILQAADIVLYQADGVPVGEDQRQHLELTRDLAQRFNTRFGETFTVPRPVIQKATAKILDLQDPTAKMSKSSPPGCLFLLDDPKRLAKQVRSAVTDSDSEVRFDPESKPGVSNLLTIYAGLRGEDAEATAATFAGSGYGDLKAAVAEEVTALAGPFQERTREWLAEGSGLDDVLADGAKRARAVAAQTMEVVRDRIGFVPSKD